MSLFKKQRKSVDQMSNLELGRWGENHAIQYLKSKGYKILQRNFRSKLGEIDIIASKDGTLIFVEVKTQRNPGVIGAEMRVGYKKKRKLETLAKQYISKTKGDYQEFRLDVIAVCQQDKVPDIKHWEGAFGAME
jgi:putative endonuclease